MTQRRKILCLSISFALGLSLTACAIHKPARVLAPEAFGLTCPTADICIENPEALSEATRLRNDAVTFVEANIGALVDVPRILFCSTRACFSQFGNPQIAAQIVYGYEVLVINEAGWSDHIVRHELIHHWQTENFGLAETAYRLPRWFIEGMAYSLSEDPRRPIPRPEAEVYRVHFEQWIEQGNDWHHPPE